MFDWCEVRQGPRNKHRKGTCLKESGLHLEILLTTPCLVVNVIGRTYVFNEGINKHAHSITISRLHEAQFFIRIFVDVPSHICWCNTPFFVCIQYVEVRQHEKQVEQHPHIYAIVLEERKTFTLTSCNFASQLWFWNVKWQSDSCLIVVHIRWPKIVCWSWSAHTRTPRTLIQLKSEFGSTQWC